MYVEAAKRSVTMDKDQISEAAKETVMAVNDGMITLEEVIDNLRRFMGLE